MAGDVPRLLFRAWWFGVLLLAGGTASADYPFEVGLKGGLGSATLVGDGVTAAAGDVHSRFGSGGGGFVRWQPTERFSLQLEFLYTVKGAQREGTVVGGAEDASLVGTLTTSLTYLELPLLVRLSRPVSREAKSVFLIGPSVAFLRSATVSFDGAQDLVFEIEESIRRTELGLVAGAGLDIHFGFGYLHPEIRYTRGIISVDGSGRHLSIYNSNLMFMLGLSFGISTYPAGARLH
jgi:hypothetical protein